MHFFRSGWIIKKTAKNIIPNWIEAGEKWSEVELQNTRVQIALNWKHLSNREANMKHKQLTTE